MTKLIVFGGTGKSGKAILKTAVQQEDLEVSIFVRSPHKIPDELKSKLKIIEGNVLDQQLVNKAIQGHDVVISALGRGMNLASTTLISEGTSNVVEGMRFNKVNKLMVVSVSTELPEGGGKAPLFLQAVINDHKRMLNHLKTCDDIEWCTINVPEIYDLPYTGTYQVAIGKRPGGLSVVALDMAHFMISCVQDEEKWETYKHKMVGITSTVTFSTWITTNQAMIMIPLLSVVIGAISYAVYKFF